MEHLIFGCIKGYDYTKIQPWLSSILQSGYLGKIVILDGSDVPNLELSDVLTRIRGVYYYHVKTDKNFNFMVSRFIMMNMVLRDERFKDVKYVLATDVRDVIFQSDPTDLMTFSHITVASEGLSYKNEPWSMRNLVNVLGTTNYGDMKDHEIYCAGVIAAGRELFLDLTMSLYLMCSGLQQYPEGGGGPDQTILNYMLGTKPWLRHIFPTDRILHAGTTPQAVKSFSGDIGLAYRQSPNKEVYMEEFMKNYGIDHADLIDGKIINLTTDKPYVIVHQYDRVNEWRDIHLQYIRKSNV